MTSIGIGKTLPVGIFRDHHGLIIFMHINDMKRPDT